MYDNGKEAVTNVMRDGKEVVVDEEKEAINTMPSEKETVPERAYPGKKVVPVDEGKIVVRVGDETVQRPVLKALSVFHTSHTSRELREPSTGALVYKAGLEIKNHILRPKEHIITLSSEHHRGIPSPAITSVNAKSGEVQVSHGASSTWQQLQKHDSGYTFSAGDRQLTWEPSSMGIDLGQFKLLDTKTQRLLAIWKTDTSAPGQSAKIELYESTTPQIEALSLAALLGIFESLNIAANRDDDHGGGSRKFSGVDPGNSMDMGAGLL